MCKRCVCAEGRGQPCGVVNCFSPLFLGVNCLGSNHHTGSVFIPLIYVLDSVCSFRGLFVESFTADIFFSLCVTRSLCLHKILLRETMKSHRFGVLKDWGVPGKGTECLPAVAATPRVSIECWDWGSWLFWVVWVAMSLFRACYRASAVVFACASPTSASVCSLRMRSCWFILHSLPRSWTSNCVSNRKQGWVINVRQIFLEHWDSEC